MVRRRWSGVYGGGDLAWKERRTISITGSAASADRTLPFGGRRSRWHVGRSFASGLSVRIASLTVARCVGQQILLLLFCVLLHYAIHSNANHEVIKASSPLFCHIILAGGDIAILMCGLSTISNEMQCRLVPALAAISFSTIFGALLAKTWVRAFFFFAVAVFVLLRANVSNLFNFVCCHLRSAHSQNLQC